MARPDKPNPETRVPLFDDGCPDLAPVKMSPQRVAQSWAPFGRVRPALARPDKAPAGDARPRRAKRAR